jgi:prephenate dehydrogenase
MKLFNKVAIVGTGLIGGSIALAIKKEGLANEVVGVSRHKKNLLLAKRKGAIDRGSQALSIIKDADLLILATPVDVIMDLAPRIAKFIGKDCIVTDVGSTKGKIVPVLGKAFSNYVGSHPLAGSEKRSIANAHAGIFKGTLCILTPAKDTPQRALARIKTLWRKLGARTVLLTPETHDRILAFVSHLPHSVAFSLMNSIPSGYLKFAAAGLKDTTRIAASESGLWVDILLSNRKNMLKSIEFFQSNLSKIKAAIQKRDKRQLTLILKKAQLKRANLA